ncbi:MAG: hypothetical protein LN415_07525 [Candidatus Thermoplasmatota archaeon]|nr:hypothetical protein [Candidatus Thermoplasmatota archaeon]
MFRAKPIVAIPPEAANTFPQYLTLGAYVVPEPAFATYQSRIPNHIAACPKPARVCE